MKKAVITTIQIIIPVLIMFELMIYAYTPQIIYNISPYYKKKCINKIQQYYFENHPIFGFDFKKGSDTNHCNHKNEIHPLKTNQYRCLDNGTNRPSQIYLAGDSMLFLVGNKYGSTHGIISNGTGKTTMNCITPNSGSAHQFAKFKEVTKSWNKYPETVIASFYTNDILDDYFFPTTTIFNNISVTKKSYSINEKKEIIIKTFNEEEIEELYNSYYFHIFKNKTLQNVLRYSVAGNMIYKIALKTKREIKKPRIGQKNMYELENEIVAKYNNDKDLYTEYYSKSINILNKWEEHAKENNYKLIISFIPGINTQNNKINYQIASKLNTPSENILFFEDSSIFKQHDAKKYYVPNEGHFDDFGILTYSKFLIDELHKRQ